MGRKKGGRQIRQRRCLGCNYPKLPSTGKFAWEFQTEAGKQNAGGFIAPDGTPNFKTLFTSDSFEEMYFAIGRFFSLGAIVSSPAIDGGVIYFGSTDGNLYAIE